MPIGTVYRIYSPSTGLQYFGSTTRTMRSRYADHTSLSNNCSSKIVIACGDAICEEYASVRFKEDELWELREVEYKIINSNECVNISKSSFYKPSTPIVYEYLLPKEARARRVAYMRDHGIGLYWKRK